MCFSYDLSVKNILKFLIAVVNYSHVMNKTITLKAKKQKQKQTNKTKQNKTTVTSNKYDKKSMVF